MTTRHPPEAPLDLSDREFAAVATMADALSKPPPEYRTKHQYTNRLTGLASGMSHAHLNALVAAAERLAGEP